MGQAIRRNFAEVGGVLVIFFGVLSVVNILVGSFGAQTAGVLNQILETYRITVHGSLETIVGLTNENLTDLQTDLAFLYLLSVANMYRSERDSFKWQKLRLLAYSVFWPIYYAVILVKLIWTSIPNVQNRMIQLEIEEFEQYDDISSEALMEKPYRLIRMYVLYFVDLFLPFTIMILIALILT